MMKPYFFRIGDTYYNLLDVTNSEFYRENSRYIQYIQSLSLENRMMLTLNRDDKSLIAIIVGDRIGYPFSCKLGPFEFITAKKLICPIEVTNEMAIQHAIHYLEQKFNDKE